MHEMNHGHENGKEESPVNKATSLALVAGGVALFVVGLAGVLRGSK